LRVAWLSIILGVAMEILLLVVAVGFGTAESAPPFVADLVQKTSWSTLVCMGLALGTAAAGARVPAMGLAGLFAAPLAFLVARILHKGAAEALGVATAGSGGLSPVLLGGLKGVEYAFLGAALGWLGRRSGARVAAYAAAGLAAGALFGGIVIALRVSASPDPLPGAALVALALNEILFPVGCSLVVLTAESLGKRASS